MTHPIFLSEQFPCCARLAGFFRRRRRLGGRWVVSRLPNSRKTLAFHSFEDHVGPDARVVHSPRRRCALRSSRRVRTSSAPPHDSTCCRQAATLNRPSQSSMSLMREWNKMNCRASHAVCPVRAGRALRFSCEARAVKKVVVPEPEESSTVPALVAGAATVGALVASAAAVSSGSLPVEAVEGARLCPVAILSRDPVSFHMYVYISPTIF
jgi:hypothetical protein